MKKWLKNLTLPILSLVLSIFMLDWCCSYFISPPFQMVSASSNVSLYENEFGHYWISRENKSRLYLGCPNTNAKTKIAILGSSILYGSNTEPEDSFGPKIYEYLEKNGQEVCIINYAHPAGNFQTQLASFQDIEDNFDIIIWELWQNSPSHFWRFGNNLLNFGPAQNKLVPPDPFALGELNQALLTHSLLYRYYFSQQLPPSRRVDIIWREFAEKSIPLMQKEAQKHNSTLLLISFPAAENFEAQFLKNKNSYGYFQQLAEDNAIPYFDLTTRLSEPHMQYFADKCCHYNEFGTVEVSQIIGDELLLLLRLP